ncbi:hypothetical protein FHS89_001356 [Rubricella aquisinus]|uniref:Cell division protein FtsL n=1 Tax=Rubricella aquisinus TaxID=2028108 RepID=A0A840X0D1_9RHOB|nr:cell division protein FtsL [Rubricella aquisinus]MBB5515346.1 hypothetical protein [Rubricella aquisinus]
MKIFLNVLLVGLVVAVATWAYRVNYATHDALDRVEVLEMAIAGERDAINVLQIEWAYLNRPERLAELVGQYSDQLGLMPMDPGHYGEVAMISFPVEDPYIGAPAQRLASVGSEPMLPMTLEEARAWIAREASQ